MALTRSLVSQPSNFKAGLSAQRSAPARVVYTCSLLPQRRTSPHCPPVAVTGIIKPMVALKFQVATKYVGNASAPRGTRISSHVASKINFVVACFRFWLRLSMTRCLSYTSCNIHDSSLLHKHFLPTIFFLALSSCDA